MMTTVVDKILGNMDELIEANKEPEGHEDSAKRQRRFVKKQTDRCYRCGDSVVFLTPQGMTMLCPTCSDYLKLLDENMNGNFMYFRDMVVELGKCGKGG
jgi:hypothetical protein